MDLAKIRKKSLQPLDESVERTSVNTVSFLEVGEKPLELPSMNTLSTDLDKFIEQPYTAPDLCNTPATGFKPVVLPETCTTKLTPLEAILAGRSASGCNEESIITDEMFEERTSDAYLEFLCFRVSDEIYGINIMDIKEIIKPREVTEVPRAPSFVSGVLSLRGTIIPVIDMRIRLALAHEEPTGKERIVVIKCKNSFSGLMVDEVIQVVRVQLSDLEAAPTVLDGIDRDFISGLGRSDGRLIIILNLENIADIDLY